MDSKGPGGVEKTTETGWGGVFGDTGRDLEVDIYNGHPRGASLNHLNGRIKK